MSNNSILISVVIPTYNRAHVIKRAIDSVLAQTYTNWELIIVDNNSTDNTRAIVEEYTQNERVIYLQEKRKGVSFARNTGSKNANGDYISFLDSDDEYHFDKLALSLKAMIAYKAGISLTNRSILIDGRSISSKDTFNATVITPNELILGRVASSGSMLMFKKEYLKRYSFDTKISFREDFDLVLRVMEITPCVFISDKLVNVHKTLKYERLSTDFESNFQGIKILLARLEVGTYRLDVQDSRALKQSLQASLFKSAFLIDNPQELYLIGKSILGNHFDFRTFVLIQVATLVSKSKLLHSASITILNWIWSRQ
jgi:glycosyltransferase involved in cell wall biosynthesis